MSKLSSAEQINQRNTSSQKSQFANGKKQIYCSPIPKNEEDDELEEDGAELVSSGSEIDATDSEELSDITASVSMHNDSIVNDLNWSKTNTHMAAKKQAKAKKDIVDVPVTTKKGLTFSASKTQQDSQQNQNHHLRLGN